MGGLYWFNNRPEESEGSNKQKTQSVADLTPYIPEAESLYNKYGDSAFKGMVYDLGNDGMPELIVSYTLDYYTAYSVFDIEDGKAVCKISDREIDANVECILGVAQYQNKTYLIDGIVFGPNGDADENSGYNQTARYRLYDGETLNETEKLEYDIFVKAENGQTTLTKNNCMLNGSSCTAQEIEETENNISYIEMLIHWGPEASYETNAMSYDELIEYLSKTAPADNSDDTSAPPDSDSDTKKVLSPESAVEIYLANKAVWMENLDYFAMGGYRYGFLDLDFDGVLELVLNINDGSGMYSYNSYYKIDLSNNSVKEVLLSDGTGDGYDYDMDEDYPKLLKSKADDSYVYMCSDYERIMYGEFVNRYGTLYMQNNRLETEQLFSEYHCEAGAGYEPAESAVNTYSVFTNGEFVDVSKSEYENNYSSFMNDYTDMNLSHKFIYGKDLETADSNSQKEMLLDSYVSFSYDGFSFDNIETYDI